MFLIQNKPSKVVLAIFGVLGLWINVACADLELNENPVPVESITPKPRVFPSSTPKSIATPTVKPTKSLPTTTIAQHHAIYELAIDKATSAATITQSAISQEDWRLIADLWNESIQLLKQVPSASAKYKIAQQKLVQYESNLKYARLQSKKPGYKPTTASLPPLVINTTPPLPPLAVPTPTITPTRSTSPQASVVTTSSLSSDVIIIPIKRRSAGTPVIEVVFDGKETFEMIVDTGASGTVITPKMAAILKVEPIGQAKVNTASDRNVVFSIGAVKSLQVGKVMVKNLRVAIAGNELPLGLLGSDIWGKYEMTLKKNQIELRPH